MTIHHKYWKNRRYVLDDTIKEEQELLTTLKYYEAAGAKVYRTAEALIKTLDPVVNDYPQHRWPYTPTDDYERICTVLSTAQADLAIIAEELELRLNEHRAREVEGG